MHRSLANGSLRAAQELTYELASYEANMRAATGAQKGRANVANIIPGDTRVEHTFDVSKTDGVCQLVINTNNETVIKVRGCRD